MLQTETLPAEIYSGKLENDSMILGSKEAAMMKSE
jgi:hypothetical protein